MLKFALPFLLVSGLAACQGTGNDAPLARAAGARTEGKALQVGFDYTNNNYQTPAGSCPFYIGTSRYEQVCWPAPGGNVILMPLEFPFYYETSPQGAVTYVGTIPLKSN